jgi:hypothetical protein
MADGLMADIRAAERTALPGLTENETQGMVARLLIHLANVNSTEPETEVQKDALKGARDFLNNFNRLLSGNKADAETADSNSTNSDSRIQKNVFVS